MMHPQVRIRLLHALASAKGVQPETLPNHKKGIVKGIA
jgi:hypothetical protein